jgi:hypothetical protein
MRREVNLKRPLIKCEVGGAEVGGNLRYPIFRRLTELVTWLRVSPWPARDPGAEQCPSGHPATLRSIPAAREFSFLQWPGLLGRPTPSGLFNCARCWRGSGAGTSAAHIRLAGLPDISPVFPKVLRTSGRSPAGQVHGRCSDALREHLHPASPSSISRARPSWTIPPPFASSATTWPERERPRRCRKRKQRQGICNLVRLHLSSFSVVTLGVFSPANADGFPLTKRSIFILQLFGFNDTGAIHPASSTKKSHK